MHAIFEGPQEGETEAQSHHRRARNCLTLAAGLAWFAFVLVASAATRGWLW